MIQETEVLQGIQARGFLITQSRLLCTITAVLYQTAFTNREQAKMMFRSEYVTRPALCARRRLHGCKGANVSSGHHRHFSQSSIVCHQKSCILYLKLKTCTSCLSRITCFDSSAMYTKKFLKVKWVESNSVRSQFHSLGSEEP